MIARWPVGQWLPLAEANLLVYPVKTDHGMARMKRAMRHGWIENRWPEGIVPGSVHSQFRDPVLYRPTEKGVAHAREHLKRWWRINGAGG